jgi:Tfp pilus assembly protein PilE
VLTRLRRDDSGFGLIELLIAMMVLNIGILALFAAFNSGAVALRRAGTLATAATLANTQMERYRALTYAAIQLDTCEVGSADTTYTTDAALTGNPTKVLTTSCASPPATENDPVRDLIGPDNKRYRIDTFIVYDSPRDGRQLKKVTVVVREYYTTKNLVREASTFDQSTGL